MLSCRKAQYQSSNDAWQYGLHRSLKMIGENTNPNTNETYFIDQEWVDSLEEIFIQNPDPAKYLVLLQTGDETLDYRYGAKYFEVPTLG